jgi:hypothetical protein
MMTGLRHHRTHQMSLFVLVVVVVFTIPTYNKSIRYYSGNIIYDTRDVDSTTKLIDGKKNHAGTNNDNNVNPIFNNTNTIWIVGRSWAEGLSGWMVSYAKVMILANQLNAILVEPGIRDARLTAPEKGNVLISDIFNRTILEVYHHVSHRQHHHHVEQQQQQPLATLKQFKAAFIESERHDDVITFDLCLNRKKYKYCHVRGQQIRTEAGMKHSPTLSQLVQATHDNQNKMIVLKLHEVWTDSLDTFEKPLMLSSTTKVPKQKTTRRTSRMTTTDSSSWWWRRPWLLHRNSNRNNKLIRSSEVEYITY